VKVTHSLKKSKVSKLIVEPKTIDIVTWPWAQTVRW